MTKHDYNSIRISRELLTKIFSHITIQDTGYKTECWVYYPHNLQKYGQIYWNKEHLLPHRLCYALFVDKIPTHLVCDHLCRIPACCNPAHLEIVSSRENSLRGKGVFADNARKTHCLRGHALVGDNVIYNITISNTIGRSCRECRRLRKEKNRRARGVPIQHFNITHCSKGHPFTPKNSYYRRNKSTPECRLCRNTANQAWLQRRQKLLPT